MNSPPHAALRCGLRRLRAGHPRSQPLSWGVAVLVLALACSQGGDPDARALPPGAWLAGDAAALQRVLDGLTGLRGSELARTAASLRDRLSGCESVIAHAPESADLLDAARCAGPEEIPPGLVDLRADASLALALPFGLGAGRGASGLQVLGRVYVDPRGGVDATIELEHADSAASGVAQLLLPDPRGAGPARLNPDATLVHARVRPAGGLDLASLLSRGGQGDRMFHLTSSLFAGAALDGTWELVAYQPQEGRRMPPLALGLGMSVPIVARGGVDAFVAELEATWPIRHRPARFALPAAGEPSAAEPRIAEGACFFDLHILPEFAPCWAATGDLLVVGWSPESVQRALAPASPGERGPSNGAVLALDRWAQADASLGRARGTAPRDLEYAWRRLIVDASPTSRRAGAPLALRVRLIAAGAS